MTRPARIFRLFEHLWYHTIFKLLPLLLLIFINAKNSPILLFLHEFFLLEIIQIGQQLQRFLFFCYLLLFYFLLILFRISYVFLSINENTKCSSEIVLVLLEYLLVFLHFLLLFQISSFLDIGNIQSPISFDIVYKTLFNILLLKRLCSPFHFDLLVFCLLTLFLSCLPFDERLLVNTSILHYHFSLHLKLLAECFHALGSGKHFIFFGFWSFWFDLEFETFALIDMDVFINGFYVIINWYWVMFLQCSFEFIYFSFDFELDFLHRVHFQILV